MHKINSMKLNSNIEKSFFYNILNLNLNLSSKMKKLKFYSEIYEFVNANLFSWYIFIHHVKYLDKLIKCLEMRAKMKSVRKINEIFLCILTYIWKFDIFSKFLNFDEKWFCWLFWKPNIKMSHIYQNFATNFS